MNTVYFEGLDYTGKTTLLNKCNVKATSPVNTIFLSKEMDSSREALERIIVTPKGGSEVQLRKNYIETRIAVLKEIEESEKEEVRKILVSENHLKRIRVVIDSFFTNLITLVNNVKVGHLNLVDRSPFSSLIYNIDLDSDDVLLERDMSKTIYRLLVPILGDYFFDKDNDFFVFLTAPLLERENRFKQRSPAQKDFARTLDEKTIVHSEIFEERYTDLLLCAAPFFNSKNYLRVNSPDTEKCEQIISNL